MLRHHSFRHQILQNRRLARCGTARAREANAPSGQFRAQRSSLMISTHPLGVEFRRENPQAAPATEASCLGQSLYSALRSGAAGNVHRGALRALRARHVDVHGHRTPIGVFRSGALADERALVAVPKLAGGNQRFIRRALGGPVPAERSRRCEGRVHAALACARPCGLFGRP
jgi:hypothetical protein